MRNLIISFFLLLIISPSVDGQSLVAGQFVLEEYVRRNQLLDSSSFTHSFSLRPVIDDYRELFYILDSSNTNFDIGLLPLSSVSKWNSKRPYGGSDYSLIPNVGFQQFLTFGIFAKASIFHLQFQPEFVFAQNQSFQGFSNQFPSEVIRARFHFWNYGDYPERFGSGKYSRFFLGQSSLTIKFKSLEFGASTKNIWWGPGQWNSLSFSNNAPGFPHISLNTYTPAKVFFGNINFQLLVGKLMDSGYPPSQFDNLNERFFRKFDGDWRYLNGLMFSFSPKWVPSLNFGFTRTFHRYSKNEGNSFIDFFPVFEGFQKINFFTNGNAVEYDSDGYDQQVTFFSRYYNSKAKAEIYFEFGRRDHPLNWREFILNPEHARAYLFGFQKMFEIPRSNKMIQLRSEITQQQESINRYIRYEGLLGGNSWHTHHQARGFSNFGQALGVGIGTGSNIQTLEVSLVDKMNKVGVIFERLENHKDFYYRAFGQDNERPPWVDLSIGFLLDKQLNNFIFSSKLQLINGMNYQWQFDANNSNNFSNGFNLFSINSQFSFIYLFGK
jgi:hypothetical protein